jgi:hypothetical protein
MGTCGDKSTMINTEVQLLLLRQDKNLNMGIPLKIPHRNQPDPSVWDLHLPVISRLLQYFYPLLGSLCTNDG